MAPKSIEYKRLQQRMRRSLCYGSRRMKVLSLPLSEFVTSYFDKQAPFDYMDMDFATSLARNGCVDACTFIVAMVYLDRMRTADKGYFEASDPREMYLSSLVVACKYLHDGDLNEFVYNSEWAASASTSLQRVNELEKKLLDILSWNANVSNEEFLKALDVVESWVARSSLLRNGFCTYNELSILGSQNVHLIEYLGAILCCIVAMAVIYSTAAISLTMAPQILFDFDATRIEGTTDCIHCPQLLIENDAHIIKPLDQSVVSVLTKTLAAAAVAVNGCHFERLEITSDLNDFGTGTSSFKKSLNRSSVWSIFLPVWYSC